MGIAGRQRLHRRDTPRSRTRRQLDRHRRRLRPWALRGSGRRALKSWQGPKPYVFTKFGLRWDVRGNVQKVLSANSIRSEVEDSLRRLSVDVIDLYQMHWPPDPDSPALEEGWSTLADLKREGKVRWIGVSNFNVKQLKRAKAIAPVTSLQPPYSLVHREVEEDILPYCLREG